MNTKPHRSLAVIVCFLVLTSGAFAQEKTKPLPTLITESKLVVGQLEVVQTSRLHG